MHFSSCYWVNMFRICFQALTWYIIFPTWYQNVNMALMWNAWILNFSVANESLSLWTRYVSKLLIKLCRKVICRIVDAFGWRESRDTSGPPVFIKSVWENIMRTSNAHKQRAQATHGCLCSLRWPAFSYFEIWFYFYMYLYPQGVYPFIGISTFPLCPTPKCKLVSW